MRFFFARLASDSTGGQTARLTMHAMLCLISLTGGLLATTGHVVASSDTTALSTTLTTHNADDTASLDDNAGESGEAPSDLGGLLEALATSEDGQAADALARQVQSMWNQSGSASVDLLMARATLAIRNRDFTLALDLLDTVIALAPDFAEGWNRRATVHFLRDDYARSIADVEQVLRLEPRHFGALSGIGIMLDELGQDRQAQLFLSEALRVHPHLSVAKQRLDAIEVRLRGAPI
jgi:Flp pilus assembly protein TadD